MTLGLAVTDGDHIYGAEDSYGATPDGMPKKLVILDEKIMILTAGGMLHWRNALRAFSPQGALSDVAGELANQLDCCMTEENRAFGLVCGFENSTPTCYRLNRSVGMQRCEIRSEDLRSVQPIGWPSGVDPNDVALRAMAMIRAGFAIPRAILDAISEHLSSSEVAGPVVVGELVQQ